jgi:hypothetical protein
MLNDWTKVFSWIISRDSISLPVNASQGLVPSVSCSFSLLRVSGSHPKDYEYESDQNPNRLCVCVCVCVWVEVDSDSKIYMKNQRKENRQNNFEKKQNWGTGTTWFQNLL